MNKFQLVKFEDNDFTLDVRTDVENETVWLTQDEMASLFNVDRTRVVRHIGSIYKDGELDKKTTCAESAQVQFEGRRKVRRNIQIFNLDMIISVGYRVRSQRGILFRKWANKVLKDYLIQGYAVNQKRLDNLGKVIDIQNRMLAYSLNIDKEELTNVINEYTKALNLLDSYDHQTLEKPKGSETAYLMTYKEAREVIDSMKFKEMSSFLNKKLCNIKNILLDDIEFLKFWYCFDL